MLTRSIIRALCALLVGFLLVSNPTDMTVLLVRIVGGLFALSGLVAIIGYFINRQTRMASMFPVVGIGSLAFGVLLMVFPVQFVNYLMYVLGVLLVLIGIWQIYSLIAYRQMAPLKWSLFLLPVLNILAGVAVVCFPMEAASLPFMILGVGYILYGASEFLFGVRFYHFRRLFEAEQKRLEAEAAAEAAGGDDSSDDGFVEAVEVNDDEVTENQNQ